MEARRVLILLDYDDTLLPSTWVIEETEKEVTAMRRRVLTELERRRLSRNDHQQEAFCKVVEGFSEQLRQLEAVTIQLLSQLLRTEDGIRRKDIKIVLVSNGDTAWITSSIHGLLPGLEQFLNSVEIEMVSARAKFSSIYPNNPAQWKVCCFAEETKKAKAHFEAQIHAEASEGAKQALARLFAAQVLQNSKDRAGSSADESISSTPTHPPSVVSSITENNSELELEAWDSNTDENDSCSTGMVPAKHVGAKSEGRSIPERDPRYSQEKKMRMDCRQDDLPSRLIMPFPLERMPHRCRPQIVPIPAMQKQEEVLREQHRLQHLHMAPAAAALPGARPESADAKEVSDDDSSTLSDKENTQESLGGSEGRVLQSRSRSPSLDRATLGSDLQPEVPELDLLVVSIGDGNHERSAVLLLGEHDPNIQVLSLKLLDALSPGELIRELQYCCDNLGSVIDLAWTHPVVHRTDGGVIFVPLDLMIVRNAHCALPKQGHSLSLCSPDPAARRDSSWVFEFDIVDFFDEEEEMFTSVPSIDSVTAGSFENTGTAGEVGDEVVKGKSGVLSFAGGRGMMESNSGCDSCDYYSAHSTDMDALEAKRAAPRVSRNNDSDDSVESEDGDRDVRDAGTESSDDGEADAKDYFRFN